MNYGFNKEEPGNMSGLIYALSKGGMNLYSVWSYLNRGTLSTEPQHLVCRHGHVMIMLHANEVYKRIGGSVDMETGIPVDAEEVPFSFPEG